MPLPEPFLSTRPYVLLMTDENESGLRSALVEAEREREAVKDMFLEDTGADGIEIDHGQYRTEVTLTFGTPMPGVYTGQDDETVSDTDE